MNVKNSITMLSIKTNPKPNEIAISLQQSFYISSLSFQQVSSDISTTYYYSYKSSFHEFSKKCHLYYQNIM
jgi:hypothetical protein